MGIGMDLFRMFRCQRVYEFSVQGTVSLYIQTGTCPRPVLMPLIHVFRLPLPLLVAIEGVRPGQQDLRQHPDIHRIDDGPSVLF